jgi:hypothetical protein
LSKGCLAYAQQQQESPNDPRNSWSRHIIFSLKDRFSPKLFNLLANITKINRRQLGFASLMPMFGGAFLSSQNGVIQLFPPLFADKYRSGVTTKDTIWYRRESEQYGTEAIR